VSPFTKRRIHLANQTGHHPAGTVHDYLPRSLPDLRSLPSGPACRQCSQNGGFDCANRSTKAAMTAIPLPPTRGSMLRSRLAAQAPTKRRKPRSVPSAKVVRLLRDQKLGETRHKPPRLGRCKRRSSRTKLCPRSRGQLRNEQFDYADCI